MVVNIILKLESDDRLHKENVIPFHDIVSARECYRAGQLEIRKCAGPPTSLEDRAVARYRYKELETNLDRALIEMEKKVKLCDLDAFNISNNITKNLTLIDERIRVGLLYSVDKDKIGEIKNRFERLKSEFLNNCEYKSR